MLLFGWRYRKRKGGERAERVFWISQTALSFAMIWNWIVFFNFPRLVGVGNLGGGGGGFPSVTCSVCVRSSLKLLRCFHLI